MSKPWPQRPLSAKQGQETWDEVTLEPARPWVPEGKYSVAVVKVEPPWTYKGMKFGSGHPKAGEPVMKLTILCEIIDGENLGVKLPLLMSYSRKPGRGSKMWRHIALANGGPPKRVERLSLRKLFEGGVFLGMVRTSTPDGNANPKYSVVDRFIERIVGRPQL